MPVTGSPPFELHSRIRNVKNSLKEWNINQFGLCNKKLKEIKDKISSVQALDKSSLNLASDSGLQAELDMWLQRNETHLMQKSKDKWLKEGDANTRLFHLTAIIHSRHNRITSIRDLNNNAFTDFNDIGNCFVNYYKNLFMSNFSPDDIPYPDNLFSTVLDNLDYINLCTMPTPSLIKKTLFSFAANKSPGPDGLPPTFYKNFWKTTNCAFLEAIQHFFRTGNLLNSLNSTFIALIPKSKRASKVDHYRSISLCNITYKTISKILALRLKVHLNKCISPFQMAFVSGRNIHENSIITHEIMHYLHNKKGPKAFMAIKVDLAKAIDRVAWSLLSCIHKNLGFNDQFVNWVHKCISTSNVSFLINGSPFSNFKSTRGIRQGDPISPFLFVIY